MVRCLAGMDKTMDIESKKARLKANLAQYDNLLVAFSGGVDSTLLAVMARRVIGPDVVALTAASPIQPPREIQRARRLAEDFDLRHIVLPSQEMAHQDFVANRPDRCYVCKGLLFEEIFKYAHNLGIDNVAHGANLDDLKDYRPGLRAADEMGVLSPLIEEAFTKDDIRRLARHLGLPNWNQAAAACLASRIPYGEAITEHALKMVARAEEILQDMGFVICRVRHHGKVARIEVPVVDIERLVHEPVRARIVDHLRAIGYVHVAVDMEGYQLGSLNRGIAIEDRRE